MKKIILALALSFLYLSELLIGIFCFILLYASMPINSGSEIFHIPSSTHKSIIKTLKQNNYAINWIDKLIIKQIHVPQKGWYQVDTNLYDNKIDFYSSISKKRAKTMDIVVFAGETKKELIQRLANDVKLDSKKLLEQYNILTRYQEADIVAQRYTIARKADEKTIMTYLFNISHEVIKNFKTKTYVQQKILTIASIIQKESNSADEMSHISSVIYNRLNKNMKLQMDSTLNYGDFSHTVITPERIKKDSSRYNTYKYRGLPPTPLGTVTYEALYAATHPIQSDYLFFMLSPEGNHTFANTYKNHLKNIRTFRAHQRAKHLPNKVTFPTTKFHPLFTAVKIDKIQPIYIEKNITMEGNLYF
ncbi:MAG: endolytic transglycosylase MltG [Campylobacterota bacterium]|nr:endolytic transglycosylase MltG [Campylobacterota bacterium]